MIRKQFSRFCVIVAALAGALMASSAQADVVYNTFQGIGTNSLSGQLKLTVSDLGFNSDTGYNQVKFVLENLVGLDSSVARIYFEDGTLLGIFEFLTASDGVSFVKAPDFPGPGSPPGMETWFGSDHEFNIGAGAPPADNGIDAADEWLGVVFNLQSGKTFADTIAALNAGFGIGIGNSKDPSVESLRIAMHVISIGEDSESYILTIPLPTPLALGLAGLAGVVIISRRKRRAAVSLD